MTITESQKRYAARPYAVQLQTSDFSTVQRFDTLKLALEYLEQQASKFRTLVRNQRYHAFYARQCLLILPNDVVVRADEFLTDSFSSY